MRIRVSYTVDLNEEEVEYLLDYAAELGQPRSPNRRVVLATLFKERGMRSLVDAQQAFLEQIVALTFFEEEPG